MRKGMSGDVMKGMLWKESRVFVIGETVEEIRDDFQHGLKESYLVAWFTTKDTKSLSLHLPLSLLLGPKPVLPGKVRLVPVICRHVRTRIVRRLIRRICGRMRRSCVD